MKIRIIHIISKIDDTELVHITDDLEMDSADVCLDSQVVQSDTFIVAELPHTFPLGSTFEKTDAQ